jgi:hypothetical protein
MGFRIDNSTGTITDIKSYLNQMDLKRAIDLIEDTAMGSSERTYIPGLGGNTLTINGMVNTTTDKIFAPLINAVTSVSKTVEWKVTTARYYNGEVFLSGVQYSGATNTLQTFSANLTVSGTLNKTSIALP